MERDVYREVGADVEFVGHPLVDEVVTKVKKDEVYNKFELDPARPVIGLLPGSRFGEIEKLLEPMLKAAVRLQRENPQIQFIMPLTENIDKEKIINKAAEFTLMVKVVTNNSREIMEIADLIVVASGTATLEAAIFANTNDHCL